MSFGNQNGRVGAAGAHSCAPLNACARRAPHPTLSAGRPRRRTPTRAEAVTPPSTRAHHSARLSHTDTGPSFNAAAHLVLGNVVIDRIGPFCFESAVEIDDHRACANHQTDFRAKRVVDDDRITRQPGARPGRPEHRAHRWNWLSPWVIR